MATKKETKDVKKPQQAPVPVKKKKTKEPPKTHIWD